MFIIQVQRFKFFFNILKTGLLTLKQISKDYTIPENFLYKGNQKF